MKPRPSNQPDRGSCAPLTKRCTQLSAELNPRGRQGYMRAPGRLSHILGLDDRGRRGVSISVAALPDAYPPAVGAIDEVLVDGGVEGDLDGGYASGAGHHLGRRKRRPTARLAGLDFHGEQHRGSPRRWLSLAGPGRTGGPTNDIADGYNDAVGFTPMVATPNEDTAVRRGSSS